MEYNPADHNTEHAERILIEAKAREVASRLPLVLALLTAGIISFCGYKKDNDTALLTGPVITTAGALYYFKLKKSIRSRNDELDKLLSIEYK